MSEPRIEVQKDGAYRVSGGVPLIRVRQTMDGKSPVDWEAVEPYDVPESYELCRCGGCANKPFADEGGCSDFDGTEVAPTNAYAERAKTLGGTQATIKDDRGICSHAGFCGNRVTNVWKAAKVLDDDEELRRIAIHMVELCPSGALTLELDGQVVEPPLPVQIGVEIDGPYRVTGGIPVQRADGQPFETRHRVSLCRCGHSKNKPLCDGTHNEIDFKG